MLSEDKENKLIGLFICLDDFCLALQQWKAEKAGRQARLTRSPLMSDSEMLTILIYYHYSGYKCFQYYYQQHVCIQLAEYFPAQVSYERFVALIPRLLPGLYVFLKWRTMLSARTGWYVIDSKPLPVCHNRRIHSHKVFDYYAKRGKSSTGWFFGFKAHLVINQQGELINFLFTSGNVADNNQAVLKELLGGLTGKCFGDKGYMTVLFEEFYHKGLQLITKVRANMKNKLLRLVDKLKLRKRAVIESVNDILTSVFDLQHTRHRSCVNAMAHMLAALTAYCFYDKKPSVYVPESQPQAAKSQYLQAA
jgi:hypothetical protein